MQHKNVQDYYGKVLQSSAALQTNAFARLAEMPTWLKSPLSDA